MNPSAPKRSLVMLVADGASTRITYHYLKKEFNIGMVVMEKPMAKKDMIRRRIRKLGPLTVFGQLVFQTAITRWLSIASRKRVAAIVDKHQLDISPIDESVVCRVNSVNDPEIKSLLDNSPASVVLVNGTRIISKNLLETAGKIFINTHLGITPRYRGVHGGYWAIASNDPAHFGATVHLVDQGIDTGAVLAQAFSEPEKEDSYITYPYLQIAAVLPALKKVIGDILATGEAEPVASTEKESSLYYHPTAWQYLWGRVVKGIK